MTSTVMATIYNNLTNNDLCRVPSHLCRPESNKVILNYCGDNGVCCVTVVEEKCACHKGYTGARCDESDFEDYLAQQMFFQAASIAAVVSVVIVVLLMLLILLFYVRYQRLRRQQQLLIESENNEHLDKKRNIEPGLSWREVSVRRQHSSTKSTSSIRRMSAPEDVLAAGILTQTDSVDGSRQTQYQHSALQPLLSTSSKARVAAV
jgi:hypothetical protein